MEMCAPMLYAVCGYPNKHAPTTTTPLGTHTRPTTTTTTGTAAWQVYTSPHPLVAQPQVLWHPLCFLQRLSVGGSHHQWQHWGDAQWDGRAWAHDCSQWACTWACWGSQWACWACWGAWAPWVGCGAARHACGVSCPVYYAAIPSPHD